MNHFICSRTMMTGSSFLTFVFAVTVLVLVAVMFGMHYPHLPYTFTITTVSEVECTANVETEDCSRGNICEVGYYVPDLGICLQSQAVPGSACESLCYVDGATTTECTASGECNGTWTESMGYCQTNDDCNSSIPINEEWFSLVDDNGFNMDNQLLFWGIRYSCYLNRCMMFTLDRFFQSADNEIVGNILAFAQCNDFLDPTFFEDPDRRDCITTEGHLLLPNLTNNVFVGQPSFNTNVWVPQLRMCTFYYGNSLVNQTEVATNWNKKRSAEQNPCLSKMYLRNIGGGGGGGTTDQHHRDHQLEMACELFRSV